MCYVKRKRTTRVAYLRLSTNFNSTRQVPIEAGTKTKNCENWDAPEGWGLVGFKGRAKTGIDALGIITSLYHKIPVPWSGGQTAVYYTTILQ